MDGDIVIVVNDLAPVAHQVLHRLLDAGGELVTLVVGEDGDSRLVEAVTTDLQRAYPGAEVEIVAGGQPHYPLLIGVESVSYTHLDVYKRQVLTPVQGPRVTVGGQVPEVLGWDHFAG